MPLLCGRAQRYGGTTRNPRCRCRQTGHPTLYERLQPFRQPRGAPDASVNSRPLLVRDAKTREKSRFKNLSPAEVLALAISLEEEDGRLLQEFARLMRRTIPRRPNRLDAHAQRGRRAPAPADGAILAEVWPGNPLLEAAGRKRLRAPRSLQSVRPWDIPARPLGPKWP